VGDCSYTGFCNALGYGYTSAIELAPNDIWAVQSNAVIHYDGTNWINVYGGLDSYPLPDGGAVEGAEPLFAIWASSDTDVWAAGFEDSGQILHFDGTSWQYVQGGTSFAENYAALWGSGPNDIWAAGASRMYHWDGCAWTEVSGTTCAALGIWGSGPNDVWAVGGTCTSHYTGPAAGWQIIPDPASTFGSTPGQNGVLYAVWGSGPDDVWAVGDDVRVGECVSGATYGTALHWTGGGADAGWTQVPMPTILSDPQLGALAPQCSGVAPNAVWGSGPSDVWVAAGAGDNGEAEGTLLHYDGQAWSLAAVPWANLDAGTPNGTTMHSLVGLTGSGPDDVYAVGDSQTVLHYDGGSWSYLSGWNISGASGVRAFASDDVWAGGPSGFGGAGGYNGGITLEHWNGNVWTTAAELPYVAVASPILPARMCGNRDANLWWPASSGAYNWNGQSFAYYNSGIQPVAPGEVPTFDDCYVDTDTNLWIVGKFCSIYQGGPSDAGSGTAFVAPNDPLAGVCDATMSLHAVWGVHGGPIYAVGDPHGNFPNLVNTVMVGNMDGGGDWTDVSELATPDAGSSSGLPQVATLQAVYGFAPDGGTTPTDVFAAGEQIILHMNSQGVWESIDSPLLLNTAIYALWGSGPNDVWFGATTFGNILETLFHWDGTQLTQVLSFPGPVNAPPDAMSGVGGTDFWMVGGGSGLANMHMHYSGAP
jgi:hypothetical protein